MALRPTSPASGSRTGSPSGSAVGRSPSGGGTKGSASVLRGGVEYSGSAITSDRAAPAFGAALPGVATPAVGGVVVPVLGDVIVSRLPTPVVPTSEPRVAPGVGAPMPSS